ncbi:efflux RND transporter periplasmic adaptor subunit [Roseivirga misakiensis]|uniref:Efflux transporter periplasmic adaptor subunit n=1 Tax=Roseivirga misakiensis TaxID=1563681 RepID=A0A1E5SZ49_9BACT|nr:efflux RND transporter periplasmic adaptor subunit [Roseivirga misakiensis]OEK04390.1 efflux transporter periplasmic adaptor subunit [Roseivirga misakiensis]
MVRKIIGVVLGLIFLVGAGYVAKTLIDNNKRVVREVPKTVKTVFTQSVLNTEVPIVVKASGNLVASRKIELFSEVQGIFKEAELPFKAGQTYQKDQVLLDIDSREFYTSLLAQRSTLYDIITGMMPDLKFDYPESFQNWETYLQNFDLNEDLEELPEPVNDKEKYFVNGRQIVTTYYNIKNLEERYRKYQISAPFSGILTESLVNPGTLIRSGQKLGEFVSLNDFELEVDVNQEYIDILRVGKRVALSDLSGTNEWQGVVRRVNGRLDQSTQTVKVFIGVQGNGLIEGMYLEANIAARSEKDALEIPRNLLNNETEIFAVEDGKITTKAVNAVYFTDKTAIVKGLEDGTQIISRPLPGAYDGMLVKIAPGASSVEK